MLEISSLALTRLALQSKTYSSGMSLVKIEWNSLLCLRIFPETWLPSKQKRTRGEPSVRSHKTGCARSEGYYKIPMSEKAQYLSSVRRQQIMKEEEEEKGMVRLLFTSFVCTNIHVNKQSSKAASFLTFVKQ